MNFFWKQGLICGMTVYLSLSLSAQIVLSQKGKTDYVIATSEKPNKTEKSAALELQGYLKKRTGADFKIVTENSDSSTPAIYLGNTKFTKEKLNLQRAFGKEEWLIQNDGKNLIITGGEPRGVIYGVYDFLEQFAGCRWYGIGVETVPPVSDLNLPERIHVKAAPPFMYRCIYYLVRNMPQEAFHHFTNHVKMNSFGHKGKYGFSEIYGSPRGCHSYLDYTKDFPVEISWMNQKGERVKVLKQTGGQLCYSHPEVRRRVINQMRNYIRKDREKAKKEGSPNPVFYDLSANDCSVPCYCPECKALATRYGISGMVIDFTNAVAKEIEKEFPDVLVMMFAYKESMEVPRDIKVRDNVVVRMAFMDVEFAGGKNRDVMRPLDNPQNTWYREQMEAWSKVAKNLAIWDYWKLYYEQYPSPKTAISSLQGYVRKYRDLGVKHLFVEAEIEKDGYLQPDSFVDLRTYTGAKLMVTPDLDMNQLLDDFMSGYYGKGGTAMKQYLNYLEKRMTEEKSPLGFIHPAKRAFMDTAFFQTADQMLFDAERLTSGQKIQHENVGLERLVLDLAYLNMMEKFSSPPLKSDKAAITQRMLKNMDVFGKRYFTAEYWNRVKDKNFQYYLAKLNRPSLPMEFKDKTLIDMTWADLESGKPVDDPDAAGGRGLSVPQTHYSGKEPFHGRDLAFGVYAREQKRRLLEKQIAKKELPQDEKYHFYYLGRTHVPENSTLWIHWSWWIQVPLKNVYDPLNTDTKYDIYVSLKAQGPSYVKGSKQPDDLRIDRAIFVKVMDLENSLPKEFQGKEVIEVPYSEFSYLVEKKTDSDSISKMAVAPRKSKSNQELHSQLPSFGVIDLKTRKRAFTTRIPKDKIPQDEKYHLYKLGHVVLTPDTMLWGHYTWHMNCPLKKYYNQEKPETAYDLYISLKLQGPAYVADSQKKNDFLVERLFLVKNSADKVR